MGYSLGVDLGTTYTCAAIDRGGKVEIVTLGDRAATIPSVLFLREDGTFLVGEAAERRALTEPGRVAREFKRRLGDTAPVLVGGTPYGAEVLTAHLLRWVVEQVTEREGGPPTSIALTHPANWGQFKVDLLQQAVVHAGLPSTTTFLSEPEAAALSWASQERVDVGSVVAVYDLGGGTFDAAVLSKTATGFELLGAPQGIERLGGIDVDAAVLAHVDTALDGAITAADPNDPAMLAAVARLRREIVEAKEALSSDVDVTITVSLPNLSHTVRLTRSELEGLIRPVLLETITALRRALDVAGVMPAGLRAVLLVGGSSRIPLVAQLVAAELGRPVALDAHPKHAVALGAALAAEAAAGAATAATPFVVADPTPPPAAPAPAPTAPVPPVVAAVPAAVPAPPTTAPVPVTPPLVPVAPAAAAATSSAAPPSHTGKWVAVVLLALAIAAAAIVLVVTSGDDGGDLAAGDATTTAATLATTTVAPTTATTTATTAGADPTTAATVAAPTTTIPPGDEVPETSPSGRPITGASRSDGALLVGDAVFARSEDGSPQVFGLDGTGQEVIVGAEGFDGYDTLLRIRDEDGNVVAANDDLTDSDGNAVSRDPQVTLTIPAGQTFSVEVVPFDGVSAGSFVVYMDPVTSGE